MRGWLFAVALALGVLGTAHAQQAEDVYTSRHNYPDRQAITINNLSDVVSISNFSFGNRFNTTVDRPIPWVLFDLTNRTDQPIVYLQVVLLRWNPVNEPIEAERTLISFRGPDLVEKTEPWSTLARGVTLEARVPSPADAAATDTFTGILFVRSVRLQDGTVFRADTDALRAQIAERYPMLEGLVAETGE